MRAASWLQLVGLTAIAVALGALVTVAVGVLVAGIELVAVGVALERR